MSQQAFATKLGLSISAIQNYEKDRVPLPKLIRQFSKEAMQAGRVDLMLVFWEALEEQLGTGSIEYDHEGREGFKLSEQRFFDILHPAFDAVLHLREFDRERAIIIAALAKPVKFLCDSLDQPDTWERFEADAVAFGYATPVGKRADGFPKKVVFPKVVIDEGHSPKAAKKKR